MSISPICCVISDRKPEFTTVSQLLRHSVERTRHLLMEEIAIKLGETREARMFASLEKIFIEERMYKDREVEEAADMDAALAHLDMRFEPFKPSFFREITRDDLLKLWEIKMGRILKFNSEKADAHIAALQKEIDRLEYNYSHPTEFTIAWYEHLKEKYGHAFPRRTVMRSFDSIEATKVAEANKRLFFDKAGGFVGTSLKDNEFLFNCSDLDDILIIYRDGTYKIVKVSEKLYIGKKVLHIGLFKKNDTRTVYNVIYRNGDKEGFSYKKRFHITGLTRDKEYNITKKAPGSRIEYLSCNPNGEAETVKVLLRDEPNYTGRRPRAKEVIVDFAQLEIKGKEALGNLVTKYQIADVKLLEKGKSTLGGREVWFDRDVLRLNYDGRGQSLGVFQGDDKVLVVTDTGEFFTSTYSDSNHYDDNILLIEKFNPEKIWTLALFDAGLGYPYLKRFPFEVSARPQRFAGNEPDSRIILLTDTPYPRLEVTFGGADAERPALEIDAEQFIAVKSFKAKGKRISTFDIASVTELEPTRFPEPEEPEEENAPEDETAETGETPETSANPVVEQGDLFAYAGLDENTDTTTTQPENEKQA